MAAAARSSAVPAPEEPSPKVQKMDHQNGTTDGTAPLLRVKKLSENAVAPSRASALSAGYDFLARWRRRSRRGERPSWRPISESPSHKGTYARFAPRSGLAWKHSIDVGAGVVDADYRGPVGVVLFNLSDVDFQVLISAVLLPLTSLPASHQLHLWTSFTTYIHKIYPRMLTYTALLIHYSIMVAEIFHGRIPGGSKAIIGIGSGCMVMGLVGLGIGCWRGLRPPIYAWLVVGVGIGFRAFLFVLALVGVGSTGTPWLGVASDFVSILGTVLATWAAQSTPFSRQDAPVLVTAAIKVKRYTDAINYLRMIDHVGEKEMHLLRTAADKLSNKFRSGMIRLAEFKEGCSDHDAGVVNSYGKRIKSESSKISQIIHDIQEVHRCGLPQD